MRTVDRSKNMRSALFTGLLVGLFVGLVGLATNAENMFPSSNVLWLDSVATGLVVGLGVWAIRAAVRRGEEIRRMRSELEKGDEGQR